MIPRKTLTVTRHAAGSRDHGRYVEGTTSTFNITASVQPLQAREMDMLPENRRDSESFRLYTDTLLLVADRRTGVNADKVAISGSDYEVVSCATWQNDIINHYKAVVVKLQ